MNRLVSAAESSLTARTITLMIVRAIGFALSVAMPMVIVRRLSVEEFGLYKQAFLVIGTAMVIMPLGFAMSAFYFLPRETVRRGAVVFNVLLFHTAIGGACGLVMLLSPSLLTWIFNDSSLVPLAPVIGLTIFFATIGSVLEVISVANEETAWAGAFIVGANVSRTVLLVGAAVLFATVTSLLYAAVIHAALQCVVLLIYLEARFAGFWRRLDLSMLRAQLSYALPLGAASVLYAFQNDMHNYFVSREFGAAAFALYSVGCFHLPVIGILGSSAGSVLIPRVIALHKEHDRREMLLLTARVMRKLAAVYLPLFVFLLVMGREVLAFLFTPPYVASWSVLVVSLLFLPLDIFISDPVLRAHAETRFLTLRVKLAVFGTVLLTLLFWTPSLGPVGVIAVVVAANTFERAFGMGLVSRLLGARLADLGLLRDIVKLAAAAAAAGVATLLVRGALPDQLGLFATLLVTGFAFLALYFAGMVAAGVPTPDERRAVRRAVTRLTRWPQPGAVAHIG